MDDVNRQPPPYTTAVPPYAATGIPYTATGVPPYATTGIPYTAAGVPPYVIGKPRDDFRYQATEFFKGVAELSVEFGKGCRDVVKQSILRDDSLIVRCFGSVCKSVCVRFKFLNRYLPEDRDPMHSWTVISVVFAVVLAVLLVTSESDTTAPMIERLQIYPPNATRILLPDGRHLAYQEQGVPPDRARYTLVTSHSFLSSRLAGIPGIKDSLLQEFGVRLVSYDLPGFGESDPHPGRNLESSAMDLLFLSYAVHITDKFWVVGYSGGSMHTWAALKYIPDRIAGAFMVAPLLNPYEPSMNKAEIRRTWDKWTSKRRLMYLLARKFPALLSYFYRRSFLSGNLDQIDKWLGMSLGKRDKIFIEELRYQEFWKRDLGESVRQGNVKPFIEESVLQVSSWGFSISDLNVQKKRQGKGIMVWLKSIYKRPPDELTGFLGPIHIWQVNKYAFSGGQVSIEDHRKLGAKLEVDIPFKYLSFFLEDDKELEHIRREYGSGRMLTGEIKQRLIEVLSELVERHQAARALVTDEMVDSFMAVRPLPNMFK